MTRSCQPLRQWQPLAILARSSRADPDNTNLAAKCGEVASHPRATARLWNTTLGNVSDDRGDWPYGCPANRHATRANRNARARRIGIECKRIAAASGHSRQVHGVFGRADGRGPVVPGHRLPIIRIPNGAKSASQAAEGVRTPTRCSAVGNRELRGGFSRQDRNYGHDAGQRGGRCGHFDNVEVLTDMRNTLAHVGDGHGGWPHGRPFRWPQHTRTWATRGDPTRHRYLVKNRKKAGPVGTGAVVMTVCFPVRIFRRARHGTKPRDENHPPAGQFGLGLPGSYPN